jgi:hypothetical protein
MCYFALIHIQFVNTLFANKWVVIYKAAHERKSSRKIIFYMMQLIFLTYLLLLQHGTNAERSNTL